MFERSKMALQLPREIRAGMHKATALLMVVLLVCVSTLVLLASVVGSHAH